jgi:hypothetical protein
MLDLTRREFIALAGGWRSAGRVKVKRARGQRRLWGLSGHRSASSIYEYTPLSLSIPFHKSSCCLRARRKTVRRKLRPLRRINVWPC